MNTPSKAGSRRIAPTPGARQLPQSLAGLGGLEALVARVRHPRYRDRISQGAAARFFPGAIGSR
jgi:hypothetical protein